jgi:hypothetical protein
VVGDRESRGLASVDKISLGNGVTTNGISLMQFPTEDRREGMK